MSEINYSYIQKSSDIFRLDSFFFCKEFIQDENTIIDKHYKTLRDLGATLRSFGAYSLNNEVEYQVKGIPFVRGVNLKNGLIDFSDSIYITPQAHHLLWKSEVKPETLLLSMSGTIGDVAIALPSYKYPINSNQDIAKIDLHGNGNPYYIYAFLRSKFGQNYLKREARGSVQQHVFLSQMEMFKIPLLKKSFQEQIEFLVKEGFNNIETSKYVYSQAEQLLLEELGLKDWQPSEEKTNIKSFKESFLSTGRLDAEYYQPKYEEIEEKIKGYRLGYDTLDTFIKNYSTGYPYSSETYIEREGIPLIRINNINKGNLDLSNPVYIPQKDLYLSPNDIAKENDILISMSGTIGNSCKIPKGIIAVINQRIMRITPQNYNDDTLPIVINSIIGLYQLSRIGTGGVQTNISSNDIRKILIPKLCEDIQEKISNKIQESFKLKQESEHLLEVAKRAVEIAIEQNEDAAIEYINQNQIKN